MDSIGKPGTGPPGAVVVMLVVVLVVLVVDVVVSVTVKVSVREVVVVVGMHAISGP
jgi:hypothetical protein